MRGFTVIEALVGLLLTWLVAAVALTTLSVQRRAQAALTARAEVLTTVRTARHLLGREARAAGLSGAWVVSGDSLALRAFRGHGLVCPTSVPAATLLVAPEGVRDAREDGDSVLVFFPDAHPQARLLVSADGSGGGCPEAPDGGWERWTLSAAVPAGAVFVRYFRTGSYHLVGGALRYRSGGGGRQPLTPDVLDSGRSGFFPDGEAVEVRLAPRGDEGRVWTILLRGPLVEGGGGGGGDG